MGRANLIDQKFGLKKMLSSGSSKVFFYVFRVPHFPCRGKISIFLSNTRWVNASPMIGKRA